MRFIAPLLVFVLSWNAVDSSVLSHRLAIDTSGQNRLKGTYLTETGRYVTFDAEGDHRVDIWLDGRPLLHKQTGNRNDEPMTVTVEHTTFVFSPNGSKVGVLRHGEWTGKEKDLKQYWKRAMSEAREQGDYQLLEELSRALGEYGVRGHTSTSALSLFHLCRTILSAVEADTATKRDPSPTKVRKRRGWWRGNSLELDPLPPCKSLENNKDDECMGMCGKACTCWSWVCGNCCFHRGCFDHDICCAEPGEKHGEKGCGFHSSKCLFPFRFSCDRYSGYNRRKNTCKPCNY